MKLTFSKVIELYQAPLGKEIIIAVSVIAAVIIINLLIRFIFYFICKKLFKSSEIIDIIYKAISKPIRMISWIIGIWCLIFILELRTDLKFKYIVYINKLFQILIWICIASAFIRIARNYRNHFITKRHRTDGGYDDFSMVHSFYKVIEILIFIIIIISILSVFNIPLTGFLAIGGISGAALAFANQNLIANIFSGIAIYFDRPFSIGDWIYTIDGKIEGTVEKIGLRLTKIRGFDKRPIFVPNSAFNTSSTVNASRMTHRRIKQYIGVRYQDMNLVRQIIKDIKKMLSEHPEIDQRMIQLVNLVNGSTNMGSSIEGCFGSSSINIQIYTFTKTTNWVKFQAVQDDVMLQIGEIIINNGAEFAFPSRSLFVESNITG